MHLAKQGTSADIRDREHLRDGLHDLLRVGQGRQGYHKHPVGILLADLGCYLQGQARFAHSPRPGQREQAHLGTGQQARERRHFPLAPNEERRLDGQVVGTALQGFERRKGSGKTGNDELKKTARPAQVLEAMLAQVL